jgi:hypothetical protein
MPSATLSASRYPLTAIRFALEHAGSAHSGRNIVLPQSGKRRAGSGS